MQAQVGVSFLICTFNGAGRLPQALAHLARQIRPDDLPCEAIVIDNASTDDSAATAERVWRELGAPFTLRLVQEPRPGVAYARLRALAEGRYDCLCFVDDDNLLPPTWAAHVAAAMARNRDVGVLGACGVPKFSGAAPAPAWFARRAFGFGLGPQRGAPRFPGDLPFWYTAGLTIRKAAASQVLERGFTPLSIGRVGAGLGAGEDAELTAHIVRLGWNAAADDALQFEHVMPPERLTRAYALRLFEGLGAGGAIQDVTLHLNRRPEAGDDELARMLALKRVKAALHQAACAARQATDDVAAIDAAFWRGRATALAQASREIGRIAAVLRQRADGRLNGRLVALR